jgi:putative DNA primase/helicase
MATYTNAPAQGKQHNHAPFGNWDTDPWPEPVITGQLLDQIVALSNKHVVLRPHGSTAIALWTLHAWTLDAAQNSPLLAIVSPVKRCGKTTLLTLLYHIVPRPLSTANMTAPVLFRAAELYQPTLLIDEADTFLTGKDDLRGMLNSGHSRDTAKVMRCSNSHELQTYKTWAPKIIAQIGRPHDTLADRSISISMRRAARGEKVARLHDSAVILANCKRMAARWALDYLETLRSADPTIPRTLNDRAADNWRPLLAIADLAGGDWPNRAREAAIALSGSTDDESLCIQLLADIRRIFQDSAVDRLRSQDMVELLAVESDRPWAEYRNGKPITQRQLAVLLEPFGIESRTIRVGKRKTPKGYYRGHFDDAFNRYLAD